MAIQSKCSEHDIDLMFKHGPQTTRAREHGKSLGKSQGYIFIAQFFSTRSSSSTCSKLTSAYTNVLPSEEDVDSSPKSICQEIRGSLPAPKQKVQSVYISNSSHNRK
jgi:hypothetical protein